MIQLSQKDVAIHQCTFQAYFEKAKISLRFPSLFFVEWKTINNKNSVSTIGRKKAINSIVQFKQSIIFTTEMIFHRDQMYYLKKQSLLQVNLISNSRPDQIKLVGRVLINLSQIANYKKYQNLIVQKLTNCSADAEIEFKIKMIKKVQSKKQYHQLDKSSFSDMYTISSTKSQLKKQPKSEKEILQPRKSQQMKKPISKASTFKQIGHQYKINIFQNNHILLKQEEQPINHQTILIKQECIKDRQNSKKISVLDNHTPFNSIEIHSNNIQAKKQNIILSKELNEHQNRIKKLQTDIQQIMKSQSNVKVAQEINQQTKHHSNKAHGNNHELINNYINLKDQLNNLKIQKQKIQRILSVILSYNEYRQSIQTPTSSQLFNEVLTLKKQHEKQALQINSLKEENQLLAKKINEIALIKSQQITLINNKQSIILQNSQQKLNEIKQQNKNKDTDPIISEGCIPIQSNTYQTWSINQKGLILIKQELLRQKKQKQATISQNHQIKGEISLLKKEKVKYQKKISELQGQIYKLNVLIENKGSRKIVQGQKVNSTQNYPIQSIDTSSVFTFAHLNQTNQDNNKETSQQNRKILNNSNCAIPQKIEEKNLTQSGQILQILQNLPEQISSPMQNQHNTLQKHTIELTHEQVNNLKQNINNNHQAQQLIQLNMKFKDQIDLIKMNLEENTKILNDKEEQIIKIRQEKEIIERQQLKQMTNKYNKLILQFQNHKVAVTESHKKLQKKVEQKQKDLNLLQHQIHQLLRKLQEKKSQLKQISQCKEKQLSILNLEKQRTRQFIKDLENRLMIEQQENRMKAECLAEGQKYMDQFYDLKYQLADWKEKYEQVKDALDQRDEIISYLQETKAQLSKQLQQIDKHLSFQQLTQTQQAQDGQIKIQQEQLSSIRNECELIKKQCQLFKNNNDLLKHQNDLLKQEIEQVNALRFENKRLKCEVQRAITQNQQLKSEILAFRQSNGGGDKVDNIIQQKLKHDIIEQKLKNYIGQPQITLNKHYQAEIQTPLKNILNQPILSLNRMLLEKDGDANIKELQKDYDMIKMKEINDKKNVNDDNIENLLRSQLEQRILKEQQLKRYISILKQKLTFLQGLDSKQQTGQLQQQIKVVNGQLTQINMAQNNPNNINSDNLSPNKNKAKHISDELHNICQEIKELYNKRNSLTIEQNNPLFKNQISQSQFLNLNNQTYIIQQKAKFISKQLQKVKSMILKSLNKLPKQKTQMLTLLKPCEQAANELINLSQILSEIKLQSNI